MALLGETAITASILVRVVNAASRDLAQVESQLNAVGTAGASASGATALGAISGALSHVAIVAGFAGTALGAASSVMAMKFDNAKRTISSFTTASQAEIERFSNKVLELAPLVGASPVALEQGLYRLISAGLKANVAFALLSQSAKAAGASQSNLADVTNAADSVVNAYHLGVKGAVLTVDQMTQATKGGKTTFQELASAMQPLLYYAPQLGVNFGSLMAAFSAMSMQGVRYRQVSIDINQMMAKSITPTKNMQEAASLLGVSWQDLYNIKGKGLLGFIKGMNEASHGHIANIHAVAKAYHVTDQTIQMLVNKMQSVPAVMRILSGSQNAYVAVSKLAANNTQDLTKQLGMQAQASDKGTQTNKALAEASKGAAQQFRDLKAAVEVTMIRIGDLMLPTLVAVFHALTPVIEAIGKFAQQHSTIVGAFVAISVAVFGLGLALKGLSVALGGYEAVTKIWALAAANDFKVVRVAFGGMADAITGGIGLLTRGYDGLRACFVTTTTTAVENLDRMKAASQATADAQVASATKVDAAMIKEGVVAKEQAIQLDLFSNAEQTLGTKALEQSGQLSLFSAAELEAGTSASVAAGETGLLTGALTALQVVLDALGIGLLILAFIALSVVTYELFTHVKQISDIFLVFLSVLVPPVGLTLLLAKHFGQLVDILERLGSALKDKVIGLWNMLTDAIGWCIDRLKDFAAMVGSVIDKLTGFGNKIGAVTSKLKGLGDAAHAVGSFLGGIFNATLGKVGATIDKFAHEHDKVSQSAANMSTSIGSEMHRAENAYTSSTSNMSKSLQKWTGSAKKAVADYSGLINKMVGDEEKQLQKMERSVDLHFGNVERIAIARAKQMADGVIAEANRMKAELAKPLPQIAITDPSKALQQQLAQKVQPQVEQHVNANTAVQLSPGAVAAMSKLTGAIQQLPPQFQGVMGPLIDAQKQKIEDAYNKYIDKVNKENQSFANKMNSIHTALASKLASNFQAAQDKEKSLYDAYLQKLNTIEMHHAQLIAEATANFAAHMQQGVADFQARIAAAQATLQSIQQGHNDRLQQLLADHRAKLDAIHGKNAKEKIAQEDAAFKRRVSAENSSFSRQTEAAQHNLQGLQGTFDRAQKASDAGFSRYLSTQQTNYNDQINKANNGYSTHVAGIQHALSTADTNAEKRARAEETSATKIHEQNLASLKKTLGDHVKGIEKAIKNASDPGSLWSELEKQLKDGATKAMNALQLAVLEGKTHLGKLVTAVAQANSSLDKLSKAQEKAAILVAEKTGDFSGAVKLITDKLSQNVSNALSKLTFDLNNHTGSVKKDQQALEKAYLAQDNYSKKQAAVSQVENAAKLAAARKAGDWATVLGDMEKSISGKMKTAIDHATLQLMTVGDVSGKTRAAIEKAAAAQEKLTLAQQKAADIQTAAQIKAAQKAGDLATVFDLTGKKIQTQITNAMNLATEQVLKFGEVLPKTQQKLDDLVMQQQKQAAAAAKAQDALDKATLNAAKHTGDWATVMDSVKNKVDKGMTQAMSKYEYDLLHNQKALEQDTINLQQAAVNQKKYNDSVAAAQKVVDSIDKSFAAFKNTIDTAASTAMDNLSQKIYDLAHGISDNLPSLDQLQKDAAAAAQKSTDLANAEAQAKQIVDQLNAANSKDITVTQAAAKAKYDAALAAYQEGILEAQQGVITAAALDTLRQAAINTGIAFQQVDDVMKAAAKDIADTVDQALGDNTTTDQLTQYQSDQLAMQQQRLDLQQQKQATTQQNDLAKQSLAEQKLSLQQQTLTNKQTAASNKLTQQQQATMISLLQEQLAAQSQTIELQQKLLVLNRMGFSRWMVGGSTLANSNLSGSSYANVS